MFTQLHIFCVFLWVINPLVTPMWGRPNIAPISSRMKSFENIIITNFCRGKNYYFCSWLVVIDGVPAIGEQRFCQRGTAGGNLPHRSHWLGSLPFVRHRRPLVPLRFVWTTYRRRQGPPLVHGASLLDLLLRLWAEQTDILSAYIQLFILPTAAHFVKSFGTRSELLKLELHTLGELVPGLLEQQSKKTTVKISCPMLPNAKGKSESWSVHHRFG